MIIQAKKIEISTIAIMTILTIFLFSFCPQTPPDDVQDMVITRPMTKVVYHYGSIKPLIIALMDEGTVVKGHPTSDRWYKIWWFEKGKWKIGYVPDSCLKAVSDTIDIEYE